MDRYKFPRTPHLPWSPGFTGDDERLADCNHFGNKILVVTEKMDGENTCIYSDGYVHARSIDSASNPWQTWIRAESKKFSYKLPEGWRIYGENMYGIHSIEYDSLDSFFYAFAIVDDNNIILPLNYFILFCDDLGIKHVPILKEDCYLNYVEKNNNSILLPTKGKEIEGYVVRNILSFSFNEYHLNAAKYVRKGHVQTDEHWTKNWKKATIKEAL